MVFCPSSSTDFNLFICNCLDTFLLPFISIISDCISYLESEVFRLIQKLFLKEMFFYTVSHNTAFVTYCTLVVLGHCERVLSLDSVKCLLYATKKRTFELSLMITLITQIRVRFPGLLSGILRHRWVKWVVKSHTVAAFLL